MSILATLTNPTTRTDNSPIVLSDIKQIVLEERVQGATSWTAVGAPIDPSALPLSRMIANVSGGNYDFRATWFDNFGTPSAAVVQSISVPFAPLNPGTLVLSIV